MGLSLLLLLGMGLLLRSYRAVQTVDPGFRSAGVLAVDLPLARLFEARDVEGGPPVAILNELAARRAFGNRSALGQQVLVWGERVPSEVVGVVGNVRHTGLDAEPRPEAWRPIGAVGWANLSLVVRGKVLPEALVAPVRAAIHSVDAEQPLVHPEPMLERAEASLAVRRFTLEVLSAGAAVALLLALAGIYGFTAYGVAQRTRELGVRLALGATPPDLVRMLTRETVAVVGAGCVLGLIAGGLLSRVLSGLVFGVSRVDPVTFVGWPLVLTAVAAGAAWFAARRVSAVDPADALRHE